MLKAVIFDFDGTLVDTIGSIWAEYRRVISVMGLPAVSHRDFTRNIGRAWDEIIVGFWPGIDAKDFTRHYRVEAESVKPIPGVEEALERLSGDYGLAIMTSRGEKTFIPHMRKAGIDPKLFKAVFHRNDLEYNKPDPRALSPVFKALKLKPSESIYVGDSIIDAQCALKAGAGFVAVLTGGAYPEDFKDMGVKDIIPSVKELPKLLERV
ncbi:MAG: HAD family hydrolase [Candidatus Altiarchaeota archaeon]